MPTLQASYIIGRARTLLVDADSVRYPDSELLGWVNDGQREIVVLRPDANQKVANLTLVGGTRQSLPPDGYQLVDVFRNMGTGATPGRGVRKVEREYLDASLPSWHSATPENDVQHYAYDPRTPRTFFVFPPAVAGRVVEIAYSAVPSLLTTTTDVIGVDDAYANVLLDYVMYRALAKDTEHPANAQRAMAYRQAFENSLGLKAQADGGQVAQADAVRS